MGFKRSKSSITNPSKRSVMAKSTKPSWRSLSFFAWKVFRDGTLPATSSNSCSLVSRKDSATWKCFPRLIIEISNILAEPLMFHPLPLSIPVPYHFILWSYQIFLDLFRFVRLPRSWVMYESALKTLSEAEVMLFIIFWVRDINSLHIGTSDNRKHHNLIK